MIKAIFTTVMQFISNKISNKVHSYYTSSKRRMLPFGISYFIFWLMISCICSINLESKNSSSNTGLKSDIVKAIGEMSASVLKKYLETNNEAFVRFGRKIESIAERLIDDELLDSEGTLANGILNFKEKSSRKMSTQTHGKSYSDINREVPPDTEI
ncbi:hypothetical protein ILUMI_22934 [Ignelater luminosus]|uniref:Uncharacterized protein n=1 Tax=Ignelater luminosus TaxID=2038154 RepID=A0A8K0C9Q3_IGNLU|nr:hypothetical protein ILUMI_22934 [Ignelater luminosus]